MSTTHRILERGRALASRLGPPQVAAAVGVLLALHQPLARARWFVRTDGTKLMPDLHETLLATYAAQHLTQRTGAWSRIGIRHPGPFWFTWAAPFVAAADGHPSGLVAATLVLAGLCTAAIIVGVWRAAGAGAATVAAAVVAAAMVQLGLDGLSYPWNPTVLIVPAAAGLVLAAVSLATRSWGAAVAGVLLGAFVAQAHLGALPLGAMVIAAAAVGPFLPGPARARRWPQALLLLAALVLPWVPVALDQIDGSGNAGAVATYLATGEIDARYAVPALTGEGSHHLDRGEALTRQASVTALLEPGVARWAGPDVRQGFEHQPATRSSVALVLLVLTCIVGARRCPREARPVRRLATWLSRLGLLGLAIGTAATVRGRGDFRYYLIASSAGVGVALWLGAALTLVAAWEPVAARLADRRAVRPRGPALSLAAASTGVLVLVLLSSVLGRAPAGRFHQDLGFDAPVVAELERTAPDGVVLEVRDFWVLGAAQRLAIALERRDVPVGVAGPFRHRFSDAQEAGGTGPRLVLYRTGGTPPEDCTWRGTFQQHEVCELPATAPPVTPRPAAPSAGPS